MGRALCAACLLSLPAAATASEELAGNTFRCYMNDYTFYHHNRFSMRLNLPMAYGHEIETYSYSYDGKTLVVKYYPDPDDSGVRTVTYEASYLPDAKKMVLKDEEGRVEMCDEIPPDPDDAY
jgi:hypothetical protein